MPRVSVLLTKFLYDPKIAETFSVKDWELLYRQAKSSQLTAAVWDLLKTNGLAKNVPKKAQNHFFSQTLLVKRQNAFICFELEKVHKAIGRIEDNIILLKGAAYLLLDLPFAKTRRVADIDLLVSKGNLQEVEKELLFYGWIKTKTDNYDDMYYREWMHEIPPLKHINRGSVLDVHHNILPVVAGKAPDANKLIRQSVKLPKHPFSVLNPVDIVLHSACHLFHEGEFEKGVRDLYDLHQLFSIYGANKEQDSFWNDLLNRAVDLNLSRPLFFATRYSHRIFGTRIPKGVLESTQTLASGKVPLLIYDFLFTSIFVPHHPSTKSVGFSVARFLLYWRSHLIKMPLRILIPHLVRKSLKGITERKEKENKIEV